MFVCLKLRCYQSFYDAVLFLVLDLCTYIYKYIGLKLEKKYIYVCVFPSVCLTI